MNNKGFTLAELLIVVAIIAVLVAISIPVFTSQLEKAKEATDAANIRSAYAEAQVALISADKNYKGATVTAQQSKDKWQSAGDAETMDIGGIQVQASTKGWTISISGDTVSVAPQTTTQQ